MKVRTERIDRGGSTWIFFGLAAGNGHGSTAAAQVDSIHFLIRGGAGMVGMTRPGGWAKPFWMSNDQPKRPLKTCPGVGGKALNHLISTAKKQEGTLLVNATLLITRSLTGSSPIPESAPPLPTPSPMVRPLLCRKTPDTPACRIQQSAGFNSLKDAAADEEKDPKSVRIAGGSVKGSKKERLADKTQGMDWVTTLLLVVLMLMYGLLFKE